MGKYLVFLFIFLGQIISLSAQNDKEQIQSVFENYRSALSEKNGAKALELLSNETILYYSILLDHVLNTDSANLNKLSINDKMFALVIRMRIPKEKILKMNGDSLIVYSVNNGMVGKDGIKNLSLGKIKVKNNNGYAQIIRNNKSTDYKFHFVKENSKWKFDLTSIFPLSNNLLHFLKGKQDENIFLLQLLELTYKQKPSAEIWKPINR